MNKRFKFNGILFVFLCMTLGCATTEVSNRDEASIGSIPRPATIWVSDFAATPADVPANSALAGQGSTPGGKPQTAEHITTGRKLGAEIEKELVAGINAMGMQAAHAVQGTAPQINDLVIQGYLISFDEGDESKRVGIGFGDGSSDLKVAVEGFQMTDKGLRKLGSGTTDAEGNKTPGAGLGVVTLLATHNPVGLIVSTGMKVYGEESGSSKVEGRAKQTAKEIADVLKKRFQEQGWIN